MSCRLWRFAPQWLVRIAPLGRATILVRLIMPSKRALLSRCACISSRQCQSRTAHTRSRRSSATPRTARADRRSGRRHAGTFLPSFTTRPTYAAGSSNTSSLSRIEAEKFTTPTEAVDLEQLIEVAVESAKRMADERGSELITSIAADLPPVAADRVQVLQVLDNLITNALRYGEAGTPVAVSAVLEDEMVHFSVADRGEGIAPEHLKRLTERFYRVDASRSRSLGGTGLGLSIVKHIIERHRGRLTFESEVGKGATVHVLLPVPRKPCHELS